MPPMATGGMVPSLDDATVLAFRQCVYQHFELHGRDFPWRHTTDPYHILVSEVMLQQTQTSRVAPKYEAFIVRFPDVATLASAPTEAVLGTWQGLGYNRRAVALQAAARVVVEQHGGIMPREREALLALPGVGAYTAAAVRAFAFDLPEAFIETNIRTVFIHEFFPGQERVRDADLLPLVARTVDSDQPRRWYQALMDYGARLKESSNAARRSAHHRPQARFEGSRRQARGIILRTLLQGGASTRDGLSAAIAGWDLRFDEALSTLQQDGLVSERDGVYGIGR